MKRARRFALAVWLALALVVGQQAAALHQLAHATESISKHTPADPRGCEQHFLFVGCGAALAASAPAIPALVVGDEVPVSGDERSAPQALRLAFRSRAPPTLL